MNLEKNRFFILAFVLLCLAVYLLFFRRKAAHPQQAKWQPKNNFEKTLYERSDLTDNQKRFLRAIAIHETGRYTSGLFTQANNAFGMRPNVKRTKWYIGKTTSNYAKYDTFDSSLNDVIEWLEIYTKGVPDSIEGVDAMKAKAYFEDTLTNYKTAVKKYFNESS